MIVALTSKIPIGCTFLDWSIHWLSGSSYTQEWKTQKFFSLPNNPLTSKRNAHLYKKNHPQNKVEWERCIETLNGWNKEKLHTFYGIDPSIDLIQKTINNNITVIFLGTDCARYKIGVSGAFGSIRSIDEDAKIIEYVKESYHTVEGIEKHTSTRESCRNFLSLNSFGIWESMDSEWASSIKLKNKSKFIYISVEDLLKNGKNCLQDILDRLSLNIQKKQIDPWKMVWEQWKEYLLEHWNFYFDFDNILKSIIKGEHKKLLPMNILQEAILQKELMLRYKTRLKNLENKNDPLPLDTLSLHKLLIK